MRYLHNLTPHEKLIAQGTYTHFHGEEPSGIVEHWSIHQQPDKSLFMRVDWDGRAAHRESVLIEAWINSDNQKIERFDIRAFGTPSNKINLLRANYQLNGKLNMDSRRTLNNLPRQYQEMALNKETWLQPYGTLFEGLTIKHVQNQQTDELPIMVCNAHLNDETAFELVSDQIHIEAGEIENLTIGKQNHECQRFVITTQTQPIRTVCLDIHGIVITFEHSQQATSQRLTTYTRLD